jgi:hypothetical protein
MGRSAGFIDQRALRPAFADFSSLREAGLWRWGGGMCASYMAKQTLN